MFRHTCMGVSRALALTIFMLRGPLGNLRVCVTSAETRSFSFFLLLLGLCLCQPVPDVVLCPTYCRAVLHSQLPPDRLHAGPGGATAAGVLERNS